MQPNIGIQFLTPLVGSFLQNYLDSKFLLKIYCYVKLL
jgi:hypothetical protein